MFIDLVDHDDGVSNHWILPLFPTKHKEVSGLGSIKMHPVSRGQLLGFLQILSSSFVNNIGDGWTMHGELLIR